MQGYQRKVSLLSLCLCIQTRIALLTLMRSHEIQASKRWCCAAGILAAATYACTVQLSCYCERSCACCNFAQRSCADCAAHNLNSGVAASRLLATLSYLS
eukprot:17542-Heterococcus_DN1.PRE.1